MLRLLTHPVLVIEVGSSVEERRRLRLRVWTIQVKCFGLYVADGVRFRVIERVVASDPSDTIVVEWKRLMWLRAVRKLVP